MSAFLGPIHYWLYNKIKVQEGFTDRILDVIRKKAWSKNLADELEAGWGDGHLPPLGEAIDHSNIHGWLQERIHLAENRYAHLVTAIRKAEPEIMSLLEEEAFAYGQTIGQEKTASAGERRNEEGALIADGTDGCMNAEEAFKLFTDTFLDGMPCDHVNRVVDQAPDRVIWNQETCLHQEFWVRAGGRVEDYYRLRKAILQGILSGSGLTYEENGREKKICTI